jgi:hypothetical protein
LRCRSDVACCLRWTFVDFGGSTDIPKNITRETWRQRIGNVDCIGCHQLGQESTRTVPAQFGEFKTGAEAWMRRVGSGHTGEFMVNRLAGQLAGVPFQYFGDWTDRVAKGELPKHKPPRPQGVERNVVVTSWEWGTEKTPLFDHLVGARKAARWAGRGQRFGSPEIYNSFEFGGLLARKITGLFPLENAIEPAGPLQWRS